MVPLLSLNPISKIPPIEYFYWFVEKVLHRSARHKSIDIFMAIHVQPKEVFDHSIADAIIAQIATRLSQTLRSSDITTYYGDNIFLAFLDEHSDDPFAGAERVAEKIFYAMRAPFETNDTPIFLTTSLGFSLSPQAGHTYQELLHNALAAMQSARKQKENSYRFAEMG